MPRLVGIGEAMGELRLAPGASLQLDVSGDVFNTLAYVRALGAGDWGIGFVSAVGADPVSHALRARCAKLGIEALFSVDAAQPLGLYLINTDETGERAFTYWRSASPARRLMATMDARGRDAILGADVVLVSGITLAILDDPQREQLEALVVAARARGARLAFDPNYRARLWSGVNDACGWVRRFYAMADMVFPGLEDEAALSGARTATEILEFASLAAASEVVVKAGSEGVLARVGVTRVAWPFVRPSRVVDTTAAGDAFTAAWLVCRGRSLPPLACAAFAASTAAAVASHPGAIVPFDALPSVESQQEPVP